MCSKDEKYRVEELALSSFVPYGGTPKLITDFWTQPSQTFL